MLHRERKDPVGSSSGTLEKRAQLYAGAFVGGRESVIGTGLALVAWGLGVVLLE